MSGIHPLDPAVTQPADLIGAKAHGLITLLRLGLPVPPGFVIGTLACRAYLDDGRIPDLTAAVRDLETATGRRLGAGERPLVVSVRSGAAVSMPGMMNTVLNLGLPTVGPEPGGAEPGGAEAGGAQAGGAEAGGAQAGGAQPGGNAPGGAQAGGNAPGGAQAGGAEAGGAQPGGAGRGLRRGLAASTTVDNCGGAAGQLLGAVRAVFASWHTPRATTYRELHGIPHDLGTAVIVQAMVFGDRDERSGAGVAFSRDPNTGERRLFGDVLFGRQGDAVVSGEHVTLPLAELAAREPAVWDDLRAALRRVEEHYRDACHVEFTFESGRMWLLQVRPGGLTGRAAVRVAVDLVGEGLIDRGTAVRRVSPEQLRNARVPRIRTPSEILARGRGASPGVATGRIAVTAGRAARMASDGPVILMRPVTSPLDMHGLAAAAGIVTSRGGPTSHAAVVARSMGKPAVVGATAVIVGDGGVRVGRRTLPEGTLVTIDGAGGEVVLGDPGTVPAAADAHLRRLLEWAEHPGY